MKLSYWALLLGLVVLTLNGFADARVKKPHLKNQLSKKDRYKLNTRKPSQTHPEKRRKQPPITKPPTKKPKHKPSPSPFSHINHNRHSHHNATRQHNATTIARTRANSVQSSYHFPSSPGVQPQHPVMQTPSLQAPPPPSDSRKKSGMESLVKTVAETFFRSAADSVKPKPTLASRRSYVDIMKPLQRKQKPLQNPAALAQPQPGSSMVCTQTNVTVDQPDISNSTNKIQGQQFICHTAQQPQQQPTQQPQQQPAQQVVLLAPMNPLPENKSPPSHKRSKIRTSGSNRLYSTSMLFSALMTFLVAFCMH